MFRTLIIIGIGGFLGSVFRYLSDYSLQRLFDTWFPIGTFSVNISGSFLIGVIYALSEKSGLLSPDVRMFLAVGICGGFTTFSTFSFNCFNLVRDHGFLFFAFYAGASVFLGLLAVYLGVIAGKMMI